MSRLEDAEGLGGVVAQQDTATVSPHCAFLTRTPGSPAAPDGRREVVMALPQWVQQCCSFCSHLGVVSALKVVLHCCSSSFEIHLKFQGNVV